MELPAAFARYRPHIDASLRSVLGEGSPPLLYQMMRYHMGWEDEVGRSLQNGSGKALRPTLLLMACETVGGDWHKALPAAAALELVHNFSLIHDDIQDQDRERRHRPTVWAVWGEAQAINAGDALLAVAHLAALSSLDTGVPSAKVVETVKTLDRSTLEMVEGQSMDLSFEATSDVSLRDYLEMISKKTGALFDCAFRLGALIGTNDAKVVEGFAGCGRRLGIAFQVRDDMLGVWGSPAETGKPLGADILRRKKSLPIVYALSARGEERDELAEVYAQPEVGQEDVAVVLKALEALGAPEYCRSLAMSKKAEALAQLEGVGLEPGSYLAIKEMADFVLERTY